MSQGRILLVDDNVDLVDNLGEILEGEGYEVLRATSCATARVHRDAHRRRDLPQDQGRRPG